jgi:hypothetical protein
MVSGAHPLKPMVFTKASFMLSLGGAAAAASSADPSARTRRTTVERATALLVVVLARRERARTGPATATRAVRAAGFMVIADIVEEVVGGEGACVREVTERPIAAQLPLPSKDMNRKRPREDGRRGVMRITARVDWA